MNVFFCGGATLLNMIPNGASNNGGALLVEEDAKTDASHPLERTGLSSLWMRDLIRRSLNYSGSLEIVRMWHG